MLFLADESCDFAAVRALRRAGHDVVCVADVDPGSSDETVVELAHRERRILLTEDRDFGRLFHARGFESSGVIFVRFPAAARNGLGPALVALVERLGGRLRGKFAVLQPGRVRISE